ncbi:hypothetical protein [Microcoleus sp. BROC3]|uniref:hypothetical protein n=1 Tax=Microcoleus sp. BROC3 TaxID=3055323 RepID=UPI002FD34199
MCAIAPQIEQFLPEIFNIAGSRGIVGSREIYSDSKESGFFTGIKSFKGFDAVFSSVKPGFCVISALLILGRSHASDNPTSGNACGLTRTTRQPQL